MAKYNEPWLASFEERMAKAGEELGIRYNFDGIVGNSLKSLRLLRWAARFNVREGESVTVNVQEMLADVLARYHFEEATTVGKEENLRNAVAEVNATLLQRGATNATLPGEKVEDLLADHSLDAAVKESPFELLYSARDLSPFLDPSRGDLCQELAVEVINELRAVSATGVNSIPVILFFLPSSPRPAAVVNGSATAAEFSRTIGALERKVRA